MLRGQSRFSAFSLACLDCHGLLDRLPLDFKFLRSCCFTPCAARTEPAGSLAIDASTNCEI